MTAIEEKSRGGVVAATVFALLALVILIGLGVWQLERKAWKENLIATMTARLDGVPRALPPRAEWPALNPDRDEYTRVHFAAEFLDGQEALVYAAGSGVRTDIKGPGYFVFAPARLPDGSIVVVDRGFLPPERKDLATRAQGAPHGTIDIVGVMRWPESRGMFTPPDDLKSNVWYLRDPAAMARAKHWGAIAPFYIDQEAPVPSGGLPLPGKLVVHLPDNHLQYAVTWFGLALGLAGVYAVWLAGRLRRKA